MQRLYTVLIVGLLLVLTMSLAVPALADDDEDKPAGPPQPDPAQAVHVLLETSMGDMTLELWPDLAPVTVENFLSYVRSGFYEGTIFHRVMEGFMIQGGGFTPDLSEKPTMDSIANEADNGLKHELFTVAMARTGDPNSATSQFFINTKRNRDLDYRTPTELGWGYCVFGKVIEGQIVAKKIEWTPVKRLNKVFEALPLEPVIIRKATLLD